MGSRLKLKDLENRKYSGMDCVAFELPIADNDGNIVTYVRYIRAGANNPNSWKVTMMLEKAPHRDRMYYEHTYTMPKANMSLVSVALTGLYNLRNVIRMDVEFLNSMAYGIAEVIGATEPDIAGDSHDA